MQCMIIRFFENLNSKIEYSNNGNVYYHKLKLQFNFLDEKT